MNATHPLNDEVPGDDPPYDPNGSVEDLDSAFDTFLVRYATHLIPDGEVSGQTRPELLRLITPPEVTFAACLADGSIVICCPDGIPRELLDRAVPLEPTYSPPALKTARETRSVLAQPLAQESAEAQVLQRLAEIDSKIDKIAHEGSLGAKLAERLESLGSAIVNGLDRVDRQTDPSQPNPSLQAILEKLEQARADATTLSAGLTSHIQAMEARVTSRIDKADDPRGLSTGLRQIEGKLDLLAMRPVPNFDLAGQRKGFASFLDAIGTVVSRIDMAADRLVEPPWDSLQNRIAEMDGRIRELQCVQSVGPSPAIEDIARDVASIGPTQSELLIAIDHLGHQVEGLITQRSANDGRQQTSTLTATASAVSCGAERMEALLADLRAHLSQMDGQIGIELARVADGVGELTVLGRRTAITVANLSDRPGPTIDMTQQRKSLAQFATGLGVAVRRLETVSKELAADSGGSSELRAMLHGQTERQNEILEAVKSLQSPAIIDAAEGNRFEPDFPPQQELMDHLRNILAETLALEIRSLAMKGGAVA